MEQWGVASQAQGTLTMAVGRVPSVPYLCLGQSAFIPDSLPATLPFLSCCCPQGLASWMPICCKGQRQGGDAPSTGLAQGDPGGHLLCGLSLGLVDVPANPALPCAWGEGLGCHTAGNSAVHPVPLGHRLGCSGETVDLTCQGCDDRPLMVSSIVQFTNNPVPSWAAPGLSPVWPEEQVDEAR